MKHMDNVTIVEMLRMIGHWIEPTKFEDAIHEKLGINERHTRRRTKVAIKNGEVLKRKIPGTRIFLLGLNEFGISDDCYRTMYFDCGLDEAFGDKPRIKF